MIFKEDNIMKTYQLEFTQAQIGLKNLEGREGRYNKEGERSFAIFLTPDQANELIEQGLNVKPPKFDEEGNQLGRSFIKVKVRFDIYPPEVFFSRGELDNAGNIIIRQLPSSEMRTIDNADIEFADLKVNVRGWEKGPNSGKTVYLASGVFVAKPNPMMDRYTIVE